MACWKRWQISSGLLAGMIFPPSFVRRDQPYPSSTRQVAPHVERIPSQPKCARHHPRAIGTFTPVCDLSVVTDTQLAAAELLSIWKCFHITFPIALRDMWVL